MQLVEEMESVFFPEFEAAHLKCSGRALVVGSKVYKKRKDRRLLYKEVVGVDMLAGEGVDVVCNLEHTLPAGLGTFYHIDCLSVLEHSRKPWTLAENLQRLLEPGGTLLLSAPFVWRIHAYPSDYWRFTIDGVQLLFPEIEFADLCWGSNTALRHGPRVGSILLDGGNPFFERTEVYGFGHKKE